MLRLLSNVLERYITSFFDIIPEVTKNWFVVYKYAFYIGAIFIYLLTFIVLITVILIIVVIAAPVSSVYDIFFAGNPIQDK